MGICCNVVCSPSLMVSLIESVGDPSQMFLWKFLIGSSKRWWDWLPRSSLIARYYGAVSSFLSCTILRKLLVGAWNSPDATGIGINFALQSSHMSTVASQIMSPSPVCPTTCTVWYQRSTSFPFVRVIHRWLTKGQECGKRLHVISSAVFIAVTS